MVILVVEDDEVAARALVGLLQRMGHEAIGVTTGADTLDVMGTLRPDCVVLDCELPDCSGFDLLSRLRENPHFADLPVVFYSGLEDPAAPQRARAFDGVNWVPKRNGAVTLLAHLDALGSP